MDLSVKMNTKSIQLRIENMSESANGKTINAFEVRLIR